MHVRQIAISAMLIVLVCTPGFALAQGGRVVTGSCMTLGVRVPLGDRRIGVAMRDRRCRSKA